MSKRYTCELRPTPATSVIIKPQPLRRWEYTWTTSTMLILSPMTVVIVGKSSKLNTILDGMPSQYTRWNLGHDRSMVDLQSRSRLAWKLWLQTFWQLIWIGMSKWYTWESSTSTPTYSVIIEPQPLRCWEYTWTKSTTLTLSLMTGHHRKKFKAQHTILVDIRLVDMPSQYTRWNFGPDLSMIDLQIQSRLAWKLCDFKKFLAANLNWHVKAVRLQFKAPATSVIIKTQPLRRWEHTWKTSTISILSPLTMVIVGKSSTQS